MLLTSRLDSGDTHEMVSGAETVVAVGGDGTVSRLLPGLFRRKPPPALALIPLGTSNDLARTLGISVQHDYSDPQTLRETLDKIVNARRTCLDVLCVNEKALFCNYFGIGLDAAIVQDFDNARNSRWAGLLPAGRATNNFLYLLMGLKNARFYLKPPMNLDYVDGGNCYHVPIDSQCRTIIVSNLPVYAGGCPIRPDARIDDGLFEITVVRSAYQFIRLILTRFVPFLRLPRGLGQYRAREAAIHLRDACQSQIDGETYAGSESASNRLNISHHSSLTVLIP